MRKNLKFAYQKSIFIESEEGLNDYKVTAEIAEMLKNPDFASIYNELIAFGISRYSRDYSHTYKNTSFVLYQKYTYEDVCRILFMQESVKFR